MWQSLREILKRYCNKSILFDVWSLGSLSLNMHSVYEKVEKKSTHHWFCMAGTFLNSCWQTDDAAHLIL